MLYCVLAPNSPLVAYLCIHAYMVVANNARLSAVSLTAPGGPDVLVAKMLQGIRNESLGEAQRGGHNCKMALMSHHSRDRLRT